MMAATTLLEVPMWVKYALEITDMTVYLNPNDNSDYVGYDTAPVMISSIGVNPWGGVDYDKTVYEEHSAIIYQPLVSSQIPEKPLPPFRPAVNLKRRAADVTYKIPKRRKTDVEETHRISGEAFVSHFMGMPESPDPALLWEVYSLLNGFKITPLIMDVVSALVVFVYSKSLENTMGCGKRSKTFKAQLDYLLINLQHWISKKKRQCFWYAEKTKAKSLTTQKADV